MKQPVQTMENFTHNVHLTVSVALVYPKQPQKQFRVQTVLGNNIPTSLAQTAKETTQDFNSAW